MSDRPDPLDLLRLRLRHRIVQLHLAGKLGEESTIRWMAGITRARDGEAIAAIGRGIAAVEWRSKSQ
jgi:hypothetical protein